MLFIHSVFMAACSEESPEQTAYRELKMVWSDASNRVAANDLAGAERVIQAGLIKHRDHLLMGYLAELYQKSGQWEKLETYINLNSLNMPTYRIGEFEGAIASRYFESRNWDKAASYFLRAGKSTSAETSMGQKVLDCNLLAGEYYMNAAIASYNGKYKSGLSDSILHLHKLRNDARCASSEAQLEISKYIIKSQKLLIDQ